MYASSTICQVFCLLRYINWVVAYALRIPSAISRLRGCIIKWSNLNLFDLLSSTTTRTHFRFSHHWLYTFSKLVSLQFHKKKLAILDSVLVEDFSTVVHLSVINFNLHSGLCCEFERKIEGESFINFNTRCSYQLPPSFCLL